MQLYRADTIVACATPAGRGAIAIVRLSGRDAFRVSSAVFRPRGQGLTEPWRMRLGTVLAADGTTSIDEVLGIYFPGPRSFTGEDIFEIHCHGSPVVVEQIVGSAIAAGARAAERGEFTRRAVLNGKLDLLQAEAIADLIDARMAPGAMAAWNQLQGALSGELTAIRASLVAVLAQVEADVDFSEDELPDVDFAKRTGAIESIAVRLEALLGGFAASRRQREGLRVAFIGRPNAGKSSLINALLGSSRMIVSDEPGTTRDVVEEVVDLGGIAFVLCDSAGIREAPGSAEREAVARARVASASADFRVLVVDASVAPDDDDVRFWTEERGVHTLVVLNKTDLGFQFSREALRMLFGECAATIRTSVRTGEGCASLAIALVEMSRERLGSDGVGISRLRHRKALENALLPIRRAKVHLASESASELAALELRSALAELASISEPVDNEEVLDSIFAEFCIGK